MLFCSASLRLLEIVVVQLARRLLRVLSGSNAVEPNDELDRLYARQRPYWRSGCKAAARAWVSAAHPGWSREHRRPLVMDRKGVGRILGGDAPLSDESQ
jgi:hypothetical protein